MRKAAVTVVVVVWRPTTIIIISGVVKMNDYTYQQKIKKVKEL
jgi:menaquinone-dependent protoporphyrinogen IX oxidase